MKVTGETVVSLEVFSFTDLRGVEARCAETNRPLQDGEKVIIFAEGTVKKDGSVVLIDPAIRFITTTAVEGKGSPIEEFIARYLNNQPQPAAIEPALSAAVPAASSEA